VKYHALAHRQGDHVAVAVRDLSPGDAITVRVLDGGPAISVDVLHAIPLGHKVALSDLGAGADVVEYGERIGRASVAIKKGAHVHTHNVKTVRWSV
jgi:(2R)-sulfolactate sulfo-lyase subunit alpha